MLKLKTSSSLHAMDAKMVCPATVFQLCPGKYQKTTSALKEMFHPQTSGLDHHLYQFISHRLTPESFLDLSRSLCHPQIPYP